MEKKQIAKRIQNGRPTGSARRLNLRKFSYRRPADTAAQNAEPTEPGEPEPLEGTGAYTPKRRDRKARRQAWAETINEQAPQDNVQQGQEETGENQPDTEQGQEQA